jgi:hypothetical protein
MFGVLNRFISSLDGEPQDQQVIQGAGGFQVLQNTNKELPLEPWFDFIIGINGRTLVYPINRLLALLIPPGQQRSKPLRHRSPKSRWVDAKLGRLEREGMLDQG